MQVLESKEWHEDLGASVFISFSRDENGNILGEPPEFYFGSGYLEENFDFDKWTHFIDDNFNFIFEDADPKNFPPRHKDNAFRAIQSAEKAAYKYCCDCDIGPERERAFQIYENVRTATRNVNC